MQEIHDQEFLVVPLRKEKKFMKIDYGLIKQIYRIVVQDLVNCGIHLELKDIPPDSELHGYIVENLLNYQKYYADCTVKVRAGDCMNYLTSSQSQASMQTYTQYYNSKYFLAIPEQEELTQCTYLPVLGNDADIRYFQPVQEGQDNLNREIAESKMLKHKVALPKRVLRVIPLDASLIEKANALPPILYRLQRSLLLNQLHSTLFDNVHYSLSKINNLFQHQHPHSKIEISLDQLQECLTCKNMNQNRDYERLQFLGDTVLKLITTADLVLHDGAKGEGILTRKRSENYVSNLKLMEISNALALPGFIQMFPVQFKKLFIPPGFTKHEYKQISNRARNLSFSRLFYLRSLSKTYPHPPPDLEEAYNQEVAHYLKMKMNIIPELPKAQDPGYQKLPNKVLADVVEALIGRVFLKSGLNAVKYFLAHIKLLDSGRIEQYKEIHAQIQIIQFNKSLVSQNAVGALQQILKYKFTYPSLLRYMIDPKNLEHGCQWLGKNHQILEFLGDAVLDMFVVSNIYGLFQKQDPSVYTTLKSSFVCNQSLCLILIHSGIYTTLSSFFPRSVQNYGKKIIQILEENKQLTQVVDSIQETREMKFLADFMEAIIGAVFLDNGDLQITFKWLKKLLKPYSKAFLSLEFIEQKPHYALHNLIGTIKLEELKGIHFIHQNEKFLCMLGKRKLIEGGAKTKEEKKKFLYEAWKYIQKLEEEVIAAKKEAPQGVDLDEVILRCQDG